MKGITVEYVGTAPSDVAAIENSTIDIRDSRFTGGVFTDTPNYLGNGLHVAGSTGSLNNVTFDNNGWNGLSLSQSDISVKGSTLASNASGLTITSGSVTADGNDIRDNTTSGVWVLFSADAMLTNNTIDGNGGSGIEFLNARTGSASGNTVTNNLHSGIWVAGTSAPALDGNTANQNAWNGISYIGSTGGTATGNDIGTNGRTGIYVSASAAPELSGNDVHGSLISGITYVDGAAGTAKNNVLHDNADNGIFVEGTATPTLTTNDTHDNGMCGILAYPGSTPTTSGNTFSNNAIGGACDLEASSIAEFSGTQGQDGWSYGYYDGSSGTPFTTGDFQQLPDFDAGQNAWLFANQQYWTTVGSEVMAPNGSVSTRTAGEQWAVRRWTSDVSGNVTLYGKLYKFDTTTCSSCDGVTGHIIVDGTSEWTQPVAQDDATGVAFDLAVPVSVGSKVDFAVAPNTTDYADGSGLRVMVISVR